MHGTVNIKLFSGSLYNQLPLTADLSMQCYATYSKETNMNDKKTTQKYLETIIELHSTAEIILAKS